MSWLEFALLCIPLLPALAGLFPIRSARAASTVSVGALLLSTAAAAAAGWGAFHAPAPLGVRFALGPSFSLGLMADRTSATFALLITSLGWCVLRFSARYLQGEARHASFLRRVSLTLAAVTTLCLAGDLAVLVAAWVGMSLLLHGLLVHYPERPQAQRAAKTKFVFSRLAELCLLAAVMLLHARLGTLELPELFRRAAVAPEGTLRLPSLLLVGCAVLKSAQFPFHTWLPDTMETPTPVSALMHAGIVNAGGFLMIRLCPVIGSCPAALNALVLTGTITAVFGAVVMLTQPSVKRSLAYSTIAQMGFMLLECGLGLFGLALIHILAHSVYKAHAFLRAGSAVKAAPRALVPLRTPALVGGVAAAVAMVLGAGWLLALPTHAGSLVMGVVLASALAYGLARHWSVARGFAALAGLGLAAGFALAASGLHRLSDQLLPGLPPAPVSLLAATFAAAAFLGLFTLQALLWRSAASPFGRALYVHALNGFYVGALSTRLLERCWPAPTIKPYPTVEITALEGGWRES
ncbi:MAG TPA: proton-conducting transporter membrane subunit [Polyangiaceae bacterium]|nr:proton-conducting transporter membrane subunit [Polyangiaceae bacterium]